MLRFLKLALPKDIKESINSGNLSKAEEVLKDNLIKVAGLGADYVERLTFELERIRRLRMDYCLDVEEAFKKFKEVFPEANREVFTRLMKDRAFDMKIIDGNLKFFREYAFNFSKMNKEWRRKAKEPEIRKRAREVLLKRQDEIIKTAIRESGHISPIKFRILHKLSLKPGVVPSGEEVRVWIPIPRVCNLHPSVRILRSSHKVYLSHEQYPQRTTYLEGKVKDEKPTEFWVEYEYIVRAFYLPINPLKVKEYDTSSSLYLTYTAEKPPNISFTPYLEELTNRIVSCEDNPYLKAKRIYNWIITHVTYNLSYDYSLYDNIPEFVARERRGDCGMQALLFITLCRIAGIPARWQSGWYMNPVKPSMHDWAQFYVEPYGWLYADLSFGGSMPQERKEFYFGNIEGFRMAANEDISVQYDPPKRFLRSDPIDSQRGEVEWKYGNLYYDKWNYEVKVIKYEKL